MIKISNILHKSPLKLLFIGLSSIGIIFASGALTLLALVYFTQDEQSTPIVESTTKNNYSTTQSIINSVTPGYDKDFSLFITVKTQNHPYYIAPRAEQAVEKAFSLSQAQSEIARITKLLEDAAFTAQTETTNDAKPSNNQSVSFQNSNHVCRATVTKTPSPDANEHTVAFGCVAMKSAEEESESLLELYNAYVASNSSTTKTLLLSGLLSDEPTPGYTMQSLIVGTAENWSTGDGYTYEYFYKTPAQQWQHFYSGDTDGVVPCSAYATADLKKSNLGQTCYVNQTAQKVTLAP